MDLISFLPQFGNFFYTVGVFLVALIIIVAVHEYGHYIVGKWSGIHSEVFSIGFGKVLWSRIDKHGTQWQIAAIPLGGYCKFLGDSTAASGVDGEMISTLSDEERRRTMHGAPLWARAATVAAGPIFNFILSIGILTGMGLFTGVATYPPKIDSLYALPNSEIGLQAGDKLVAVEGVEYPAPEGFSAFADALPLKPLLDYTIDRAGDQLTVKGPPLMPARINFVSPESAAARAGIMVDDVILSIGGQPVFEFGQMVPLMNNTQGAPTKIEVWRDGQTLDFIIEAELKDLPKPDNSFETRYVMGVSGNYFFTPATETIGPWDAAKEAVTRTYDMAALSISGLYHMIAGKISACNMSGPVGMAKGAGQMASQGTQSFIYFIALLSTAVGLLNLFPIPVLDGGHLVFFAYEAVFRRPPNEKVLNGLMMIGLILLLSMMVFATLNDIFGVFC